MVFPRRDCLLNIKDLFQSEGVFLFPGRELLYCIKGDYQMEIEKMSVSDQQRVVRFVRELSRSFRRIKQSVGVDRKLEYSAATTTSIDNKADRSK